MTSAAEGRFDAIIVGAGTAGCVLAGRLTERPDCRVLLLEAGPDHPPGREPADLVDPYPVALGNPALSWPGLLAETGVDPGDGSARARRPFLQGYGVGGSSNIQGMVAIRGLPEDYDEWASFGIAGWSWRNVLPYFRKLERDFDFGGADHGQDGPLPVRRVAPEAWAPFSRAVADALRARGAADIADLNADFRAGLSPLPMANLPDRRVSAAMAWLPAAVRARPNLVLLPRTSVRTLILDGAVATGVVAERTGATVSFAARETILCAGALFSPALLLRAGIGPAAALAAAGIAVVRDRPGVGANLQNHPKIDIAVHLKAQAEQPSGQRGFAQNCFHFSSGIPGCPADDMLLVSINRTAWHRLGARVGALAAAVHKPFSKGRVTLDPDDPWGHPRIAFDFLGDRRDEDRLIGGLALLLSLLDDPGITAVRNEAFSPRGALVARLNRRTARHRLEAYCLARLLALGPVRRWALAADRIDPAALAADTAALRRYVRRRGGLSHHVAGTCRMGSATDREAVVDAAGRVHGVSGLRVVDASIFPTLMRANTHLPVLMAAELIADRIKAEDEGGRHAA